MYNWHGLLQEACTSAVVVIATSKTEDSNNSLNAHRGCSAKIREHCSMGSQETTGSKAMSRIPVAI